MIWSVSLGQRSSLFLIPYHASQRPNVGVPLDLGEEILSINAHAACSLNCVYGTDDVLTCCFCIVGETQRSLNFDHLARLRYTSCRYWRLEKQILFPENQMTYIGTRSS